jgi:NADH dehydrogenase/NADH:ubiquinone oxidoreductase subunit G
MSTIEIIVQMMSALDHAELCTVMKAGADLLTKGVKAAPKASRATGVVPPQLAKNKEWVEIVFTNAKENGWEIFEAKDGDSVVVMEASVSTEEGPRFEDGSEITMKHAMSLAKHLKDSGAELWVAFSDSYDEEHPKEVKSESATTPVRRTRAEISAAAEERKARLEEEKAEKARIRAEEKEAREAKKAEEAEAKAAAKAEREAKAAAAKAEKEAAKISKLPAAASSATATRMAALLAKVKPTAAVAAPAAESATAAVSASAKKSSAQTWKVPADGAFKLFPYKGKFYMANNQYHVYTKTAVQGELGDWVGQYIVDEDRIDESVEEPVDE